MYEEKNKIVVWRRQKARIPDESNKNNNTTQAVDNACYWVWL